MRVRDLIEALSQFDPDEFVDVQIQSTRKIRWGSVLSVRMGSTRTKCNSPMRAVVIEALSEGKRDTTPTSPVMRPRRAHAPVAPGGAS